MEKSAIIMSFSGAYGEEPFCNREEMVRIDCTHLDGTDGYCDGEAARALKELMSPFPAEGIHFLDSGNYHYLTKFWTDKISRPFSLIVFDHHPDMQPALFETLLSCGSWVKEVIDTNPFLRQVLLVGASERLVRTIPEGYRSRIRFYGEQALRHEEAWRQFAAENIREPVYISIDKDVLDPRSAATNWDQGSLSLDELEQLLAIILRKETVIGVDICGEYPATSNLCEEAQEAAIDNHANQELLNLFIKCKL